MTHEGLEDLDDEIFQTIVNQQLARDFLNSGSLF